MIKPLLIFISLFYITGSVFGQIATPYLDTALPTELASANSWRFGSTFGGEQVNSEVESDSEKVNLHNTRSALLFAYQPTQVSFELYAFNDEVNHSWDPSNDTFQEYKSSVRQFGISIRGDRQFSVGVGAESSSFEIGTNKFEQKSYGGSFSIRTLENIYFAVGIERLTLSSDVTSELKWDQLTSGVALQVGEPGGTMFRMEINGALSPKTESGNSSRAKITELQGSTELLWEGFLFSYRYATTTVEATSSSNKDTNDTSHRYGLGKKFDNLSFGFYRTASLTEYGDKDFVTQQYKATFGVSFM